MLSSSDLVVLTKAYENFDETRKDILLDSYPVRETFTSLRKLYDDCPYGPNMQSWLKIEGIDEMKEVSVDANFVLAIHREVQNDNTAIADDAILEGLDNIGLRPGTFTELCAFVSKYASMFSWRGSLHHVEIPALGPTQCYAESRPQVPIHTWRAGPKMLAFESRGANRCKWWHCFLAAPK